MVDDGGGGGGLFPRLAGDLDLFSLLPGNGDRDSGLDKERLALLIGRARDRDLVRERGRGDLVNERDLGLLGSGVLLRLLEYLRAGVNDRFGVKDFFREAYLDRLLDFDL